MKTATPCLSKIQLGRDGFPLFTENDGQGPVIELSDGTYPLLTSGVATSRQIGSVISTLGHYIHREYTGPLLLVNVLEGATPLYEAVRRYVRGEGITGSSVKVQRYRKGSGAGDIRVIQHLQNGQGREIRNLSSYDTVIVLDDALDSGETPHFLIEKYFQSHRFTGKPNNAVAHILFQKDIKRTPEMEKWLSASNPLNGFDAPPEWLVGYGMDICLDGEKPLHLFRDLPDVYAFNDKIEKQLTEERSQDPGRIEPQLARFATDL